MRHSRAMDRGPMSSTATSASRQRVAGRIGAKHIRAIRPFDQATGWHWHDMTGHFVFVIRGWITFRFAGKDADVVVRAGGCLSQPGGVPHNVIARSDDLELIEINLPASYSTWDIDGPAVAAP